VAEVAIKRASIKGNSLRSTVAWGRLKNPAPINMARIKLTLMETPGLLTSPWKNPPAPATFYFTLQKL